jgi:hypothetical protein
MRSIATRLLGRYLYLNTRPSRAAGSFIHPSETFKSAKVNDCFVS